MKFKVQNMNCRSCVRQITDAIRQVDPAAKIEADTISRMISLQTAFSRSKIERVLADAGYPVEAIT